MSLQADEAFAALYEVSLPAHPYPGLRPFREDEWPVFFGRETIIEHVTGELIDKGFVSVHGDSGSGKSSLVRAGVLPRLVQDLGRGGATWRTASMEPGNAPLRNLANALSGLNDKDDPDHSSTHYRRILNLGRDAAGPLIDKLRRGARDHLCILIDQFEEIFAFAGERSRTEAELFIDVLTGIQRERPDGLHVILTMRSEYLGACARFPGLAEAINATQYLLPPMRRSALIRAICEPALLYGGRVETDLAEQLIADTGGTVDQLPLIQHGLMLMQRRAFGDGRAKPEQSDTGREGWVLTLADYRESSGVADLLSDHADKAMDSVIAGRELGDWVIETVFRALTDIDADGHAIRRRQTLQELADVSDTTPEYLAEMLLPMRLDGVSFLRPYGDTPLEPGDEITISHEALIRCWQKISDPKFGWLQREFQDGLIWKSLLVAADAFEKDPTAVLSPAVTEERGIWMMVRNAHWAERYGGRFDDVQKLLRASEREMRRQKITKATLGFTFIGLVAFAIFWFTSARKASELEVALEEARVASAAAERARNLAEAETERANLEKDRAEQAEQQARNALADLVAEQEKREETERENNKLRSQLLAQKSAEATANGDAGSGLAMALEVLQDKSTLPFVPEAERQVYAALFNLRETTVLRAYDGEPSVNSAAFSPDGKTIVSGGDDGTVRVRPADGNGEPRELTGRDSVIASVAFSPDGRTIAAAGGDAKVRVWSSEGSAEPLVLDGHENFVTFVSFSPDSRRIASASYDGTVRVWRSDGSGEPLILRGHEGWVRSAAFDPDGERIVSAGRDGTVRVWNADGSGEPLVMEGHDGWVRFATFSPNGKRIVSAGDDGTVRVWAAGGSGELLNLEGHEGVVWSAEFSPDMDRIVSAGRDGTVRIWPVGGSGEPLVLRGHDDEVTSAEFSPDSTHLVSSGGDGTVRVWTLEPVLTAQFAGSNIVNRGFVQTTREIIRPVPLSGAAALAIAPDGEQIVRSTAWGDIGVWHPAEGQELVADSAADPDHPRVIAMGYAGKRRVAVLASERPMRPFRFLINNRPFDASRLTLTAPETAAFAPGQSRAALYFSEPEPHVELYDLSAEPRLVARVRIVDAKGAAIGGQAGPYVLGFNPDGTKVVGVSPDGKRIFEIDRQPMRLRPRLQNNRLYHFNARIRALDTPRIFEVMALHVGADSLSVVAVPNTRSLNDLEISDLRGTGPYQTFRPGPNERRPTAAAFSADGSRVAFVSEQGVSLYLRDEAGVIGRFAIPGKQAVAAAIAADGTALAATSADGTIGYWRIFPNTGALKTFAESVAPRRLTDEQVETYLEPTKTKR